MGNMGFIRIRCWCSRCRKRRDMLSGTIRVRDIRTRRGPRRIAQGKCACGAGMCKFMRRSK